MKRINRILDIAHATSQFTCLNLLQPCVLKMASGESIRGFVLKGVTSLSKELGRGAYGKVYAVKYFVPPKRFTPF